MLDFFLIYYIIKLGTHLIWFMLIFINVQFHKKSISVCVYRTMTSSVSVPTRPRTSPATQPPPTAPTGPDDEEYDVDYALESFYKDVPKVAHSQSVSLSVSTSSSSSKPIIGTNIYM